MRRAVLLAALLGMGGASAQDLAAYRELVGSLDAAAAARPQSAERALAQLDRAGAALNRLAPTLGNPPMVEGLEGALGQARAALARTPADLQAQVLLARGLARGALYTQTLNGLGEGTPPGAAQVRLLGQEFGLSAAASQALRSDAGAGRAERVAWRLQRAAAAKVRAALNEARPERTTASYLALARAAGWFTTVQEAGAGSLRAGQFTEALTQLTAGDRAGLTASLAALRQGGTELTQALATPPALTAPAPSTPEPSDPASTPAPTPTEPPVPAESPAPATAAPSSVDAVGRAYAALGRALSASGHGDPVTAREELARARTALEAAPEALRTAPNFEVYLADLGAAQERRGLRPDSVQALISGLAGLERGSLPAVDRASLSATGTFGGGLRAGLLLLALLAPVPLYLLNLAFGGRNPFWRAITAALALLLLPTFVEGVLGAVGWLGDLIGVAALRAAPAYSPWSSPFGLPLRALLTAAALGLATYGFRGLCVQFGLLGGRREATLAPAQTVEWEEAL
ncbi:hypothetical protein F8S09_10215 [Deinococcus sp. SDU3-2]|uniref:Uncharacterized protein n=1 Tax=Deinococcus terrestris TaxID=2651870 RepID=A0A7X1TRS8_9DEIO|nr:hypothetical protein [Deinococcus terrestris]MPY67060.1 hypothetical protein [Deinococcus terrestris]